MSTPSAAIDRLSIRGRPRGWPLMHQRWEKLLFLHWSMDPAILRPRIPNGLEIDTFEGKAWVGVTPFSLAGLRATGTPPLPWVSSFHELNVRTYVHLDGVPGVWFFSLYASKGLPVLGARILYSLPYRRAEIHVKPLAQGRRYLLRHAGKKLFDAEWQVGAELPASAVESLEFFLTERYCLYTSSGGRLYRCRIHHKPWQLWAVHLDRSWSKLLAVEGFGQPETAPSALDGGDQQVEVWPLQAVS